MNDSDHFVVKAVLAGDRDRYRILVDRHRDKLYGVMFRLLRDGQLAEEFAQEALVKAYTSLAGFRGESGFGTWLIQIGIHLVRDYRRRSGRNSHLHLVSLEEHEENRPAGAEIANPHPGNDPLAVLEASELSELIDIALARLPDEYREVIALKHDEGLSYEQLAESLDCSIGTVKSRLNRAHTALQRELGVGSGCGSCKEMASEILG